MSGRQITLRSVISSLTVDVMEDRRRKVEIPEVCGSCGAPDPNEAGGRWQCCGEPATARPEAKVRWTA